MNKIDSSIMHNKSELIFKEASQDELIFINHNMPRGMVSMIQARTKAKRSEILYQLQRNPKKQNPGVIQAAREILLAITGLSYEEERNKR
ncbi:MAG: hypothetical protein AB2L20_12255 [Mangrovibacterium sp.]